MTYFIGQSRFIPLLARQQLLPRRCCCTPIVSDSWRWLSCCLLRNSTSTTTNNTNTERSLVSNNHHYYYHHHPRYHWNYRRFDLFNRPTVGGISAAVSFTTRRATNVEEIVPAAVVIMYKRVMSSTIAKTSTKKNKKQQQQHDEDEEMKTGASATAAASTTTTNIIVDVEELHQRACQNHEKYYIDPTTGLTCFTSYFHLQRGYCCGNSCRHCPYQHINTKKKKDEDVDDDSCSSSSSSDDGLDHSINQMESMYLNDCVEQLPSNTSGMKNTDPNHIEAWTRTTTTTATGGKNGGIYTKKNVVYTRNGDMGTSQLYTGERRYKNDIVFEALGTIDELCSIVGICYAEINHHVSLIRPIAQEQEQEKEQQQQQQQQSQQSPQTQRTTSMLPNDYNNTDDTNVVTSLTTTTTTTTPTITIQQDMEQVQEWLLEIMSRLFDIGSHVAKPSSHKKKEDTDDTTRASHTKYTQTTLDMTIHIQQLELWIDMMTEALPELTSFVLPTGSVPAAQLHLARTVCRRTERTMVPLVIAMDNHHIGNNSSTGIDGGGGGGDCDPTTLAYINRLSDFFFTAARYVNDRFNVPDIAYQRPVASAPANTTSATTIPTNDQHHNEQRTRVVLNKSTPESK